MERPFQMDDCPEQQTPHLSFCLPVERRSLLLLAHSNNSSENMTLPIDSFRLVYKVIGRATSHTTRSFFLIRRPAVVSVVSSGWWVSESSTASFPSRDPWRWPSPRKKKSCAEKTNRPDPSLLSFLAEDGGQIATPYRNLFLNIKIKLWGTCGWEGNGRHRENAVQS